MLRAARQSCDQRERVHELPRSRQTDEHMSTIWSNVDAQVFRCLCCFSSAPRGGLLSSSSCISFFFILWSKPEADSRFKQVFTMTFISAYADCEARYVTVFLSPRCTKKNKRRRKQRGNTRVYIMKNKNRAIRPGSRAEGCFLRCCRSFLSLFLMFSLLWFGTDCPENNSVLHYRRRANSPKKNKLLRSEQSHLRESLSHWTDANKSHFMRTVQPKETQNRHKNRLDIFC